LKTRIFEMDNRIDVTWDKLKKLGLVRKWGKHYKSSGYFFNLATYHLADIENQKWEITWYFNAVGTVDTEEHAINVCKRLVIESLKTRQD
jgi:hypothetical protein